MLHDNNGKTFQVEAILFTSLLHQCNKLDYSKHHPLAFVAFIRSRKLRFSSVCVRYGTYRSIANMLRNPERQLAVTQPFIQSVSFQCHLVVAMILRVAI
jgi:hypothetical protein